MTQRHPSGLFKRVCVAALMATAGPAAAQETGDETALFALENPITADEKVVTAGGGEGEERSLASANVTVVGRQDILRNGWRSVADVLTHTLGFYVVDDHVLPAVGVRGVTGGLRAGSRIVKVMINGVPVAFRPDLSAMLGPEFLPVEAIERIEVARGPLSSLYGANAFLAVVNVITREPGDGPHGDAGVRAWAIRNNVGAGASALVGYGHGKSSALVAISTDRLDRSGLRVRKTFPEQNPATARYRPFFSDVSRGDLAQPFSALGTARLDLGERGRITVQGGFQRLDSFGEFQLNSVLTHRSRIVIENLWTNARYDVRLGPASFSAWLGYSQGHPGRDEQLFLTGNSSSLFTRRFRYNALDGGTETEFRASRYLSGRIGVDFSLEHHKALHYTQTQLDQPALPPATLASGRDVLDVENHNAGVYAQVSGDPVPVLSGLRMTGNVRVDFPRLFEPQYSWRLAAAYKWSEALTTKLVAGRAFQTPSTVLLYGLRGYGNSNNVIGARTITTSNKQLTPQTVHSVEAVLLARLFERILVEYAMFAQQVDRRIEFVQVAGNFKAENDEDLNRLVGAEVTIRAALGRFSPYLQSTILQPMNGFQPDLTAMSAYPSSMGILGATFDIPEAYVGLGGRIRWVGSRGGSQSNILLNNERPYSLDPYWDVDVTVTSIGLRPLGGLGETRLQAVVRNLFDQRWSEPGFGGVDVPNLGRTVMLEVRQVL